MAHILPAGANAPTRQESTKPAAVPGIGLTLYTLAALTVLASAVVVLTVIAAIVVLGSVAQLTVNLQRHSYALWQLIGITGKRVTWIVRAQLMIVALIGAAAGTAIAAPFIPAFLTFGLSASMGLRDIDIDFNLISGLIVIAVVTVVVSFGGFPATRRVGSVRPIEVLRESTQSRGTMTLVRWLVAAATLSIAAAMTWSLVSGDSVSGGNQILVIRPLFTASMAAAGPAVFPAILRMWTTLVPARLSASWFLARNAAQFQATRSTATINALLVTIALPGSLYAGFATLGNATAAATGNTAGYLAPANFLLLVGGSLLVSLSGAAATVLMATRTREQEAALVQAAGGTRTVVLLRAVWEALILVVTAILASAIVLALTAGAVALSLSRVAATAPDFGLGQAGFASAACAIVLVAASAIPVLLALRQPIRAVLVASE